MGKRTSQLTQLTAAQVAQGDFLPIVDVSAGQTKYVTVKDLTGLPDTGWLATGESWAYSSWSATTRIGVITVPTDATTKYTAGMRVRFSQTTGGVKYGIIHLVAATQLTVFFPTGTTLNNEAITTPVYSPLDTPLGFDKNPDLWTLSTKDTAQRSQLTITTGVWYNIGSLSLTVPAGAWLLSYKVSAQHNPTTAVGGQVYATLSSGNSTESDNDFSCYAEGYTASANVASFDVPMFITKHVKFASNTPMYLNAKSMQAGGLYFRGDNVPTIIKCVSAYL